MKLYKTTISPESNFATPLRGDTLFGQICWSIRFISGEDRLKELLKSYTESPFLVVSDAFASGYLPKPKMPSSYLGEDSKDKKVNRKKIWLTLDDLQSGEYKQAKKDDDIKLEDKEFVTIRNSIDYRSFTTGEDNFAPYGEKEFSIGKKDIYFLIDDTQFSLDELKQALDQLTLHGYGKDTTIGKGRFSFEEIKEIKLDNSSKTFMTLSPCSAKNLECEKIYYEPFTRFGKFGANRAFKNAFKKPLLLADTASVVHFNEPKDLTYIGNAIKNISDLYTDTVHQGYSIVIPIKDIS